MYQAYLLYIYFINELRQKHTRNDEGNDERSLYDVTTANKAKIFSNEALYMYNRGVDETFSFETEKRPRTFETQTEKFLEMLQTVQPVKLLASNCYKLCCVSFIYYAKHSSVPATVMQFVMSKSSAQHQLVNETLDRDEGRARQSKSGLETVSIPTRRDRDYNPVIILINQPVKIKVKEATLLRNTGRCQYTSPTMINEISYSIQLCSSPLTPTVATWVQP